MKLLLTFLLTTFVSLTAFATAQYPDKLLYDGKEYSLLSNPLETYFDQNPEKRPRGGVMSTALWRGYVATFEIKGRQLYLTDIEIEYSDTTNESEDDYIWKSVLNEVFPDQHDKKIDWFTGLLVLPQGEMVNYVHMGYGSTYERYILLEIHKGDLKREKQFEYEDYEKFKERQFQAFKETDEYLSIKADLQKEGSSDEFIDSFLRSFVTDYSSKILTE